MQLHSEDGVRRDFFDHVNPSGENPTDRGRKQGINEPVGENLYYGFGVGPLSGINVNVGEAAGRTDVDLTQVSLSATVGQEDCPWQSTLKACSLSIELCLPPPAALLQSVDYGGPLAAFTWLSSDPGHRANLLNCDWVSHGVGFARDDKGFGKWTHDFIVGGSVVTGGASASPAPPVAESPSPTPAAVQVEASPSPQPPVQAEPSASATPQRTAEFSTELPPLPSELPQPSPEPSPPPGTGDSLPPLDTSGALEDTLPPLDA